MRSSFVTALCSAAVRIRNFVGTLPASSRRMFDTLFNVWAWTTGIVVTVIAVEWCLKGLDVEPDDDHAA